MRIEIIRRLTGLEPEASFEKEEDKNIVIASSFNKVWAYATLAEAFFGLNMYDKARACYRLYYTAISDDWREKVKGINNEDEMEYRRKVNLYWQLRTTAEQLTWLADLKIRAIQADKTLGKSEDSRKTQIDLVTRHTNECLEIIFPGKVGSVNMNSINGKMGLALSGGGFRASIYHIGVLAALAEHDMLRHVEVLSCVSGGSILGAYYYLLELLLVGFGQHVIAGTLVDAGVGQLLEQHGSGFTKFGCEFCDGIAGHNYILRKASAIRTGSRPRHPRTSVREPS